MSQKFERIQRFEEDIRDPTRSTSTCTYAPLLVNTTQRAGEGPNQPCVNLPASEFFFPLRHLCADIERRFEEGSGLGPESQRDLLDPIIEILLEFE
jgi:hypothetical protein